MSEFVATMLQVSRLLRTTLSYERPQCRTCGGRPEVYAIETIDERAVKLTATCHGQAEHRRIEVDPRSQESVQDSVEELRRPWFLKNWAEHRRPTIRELLEARK